MIGGHTESEGRATSKVVGVILMVAITVILATTTAVFFVQIGEQRTAAADSPAAGFDTTYEFDGDSQLLALAHRGGEDLRASSVSVVVSGAACDNGVDPNDVYGTTDLGNSQSVIRAGSRMELSDKTLCGSASARLDLSEADVDIVWSSPKSDSSDTLYRWLGPGA